MAKPRRCCSMTPKRGVVTLVKQFRAGAYLSDGALATIEVCAGMLDGDPPDVCAIREALEETGIAIHAAVHAFDAYMSPGGMSEKIACFVASYGEADRAGAGGGVDEDEHIEVLEIPFGEALAMIERGAIADAKTIALLYYARAKGLMDYDAAAPPREPRGGFSNGGFRRHRAVIVF